jgi:hypothetical protein
VQVQVYFCNCDQNPNLTCAELGLGAGFIFHPQVHPKKKSKRNPKKLKIQKKLEKT